MKKVLVCYPVYNAVEPQPLMAMLMQQREFERSRIEGRYDAKTMVIGPRTAIQIARNSAFRVALDTVCDYVYFQDDDVLAPAEMVGRLVGLDKDIVGGLVYCKDGWPCAFRECPEGGEEPWHGIPREVVQCSAVGTGAMLVARRVIESMDDPWFWWDRDGRTMEVNFCNEARKLGFGVWCDATTVLPQMGGREIIKGGLVDD